MENFTEEEVSILRQYRAAFQRLTCGERKPKNEAQKRFLKVARGQCSLVTKYERAWRKYLDQRKPNPPFKSSKSKPNKNKKKQTKPKPKQGKKVYPKISDILNPHNGPWKAKAKEGFSGSNEDMKKNRCRSKYDGY